MIDLPPAFVRRMIDTHGPHAQEWLDALPSIVSQLEDRWSLELGAPFQPLSYHYVAPAHQDRDREVVLKLGFPGDDFDREVQCLLAFGGVGAVRVLESDADLGALLLERITPGTDLRSVDEARAIVAASEVMKRLHRRFEGPSGFPTVLDWGKGFQRLRGRYGGRTGPIPEDLIARAEAIFMDLASSMEDPVLLHADLHHENVLASDRGAWLAIDPQGLIGEPAYEVGAFLRNPMPSLVDRPFRLAETMARRIRMFSEILGLDSTRLRGWGFAQAILAAIWSIEDGSEWKHMMVAADAIWRSA